MKDILKVIRSLEKRGLLLKETTRKIISQKGEILNFLRPLTTAGLPVMKNVLTPLSKSVLMPLGLLAATSAKDAAIQKTIFGSTTTALTFSNQEMHDIMKIVELLEAKQLKRKQNNKKMD